MKASQVIRVALENHYTRDYDENKSNFMCIAISNAIRLNKIVVNKHEVCQTFMTEIESYGVGTLSNYMRITNKKYASYVKRWGHDSKACFNMRVKFWINHITELESKGL